MIKTESYTPEPRSYERVVETSCDICGKTSPQEIDDHRGSWSTDPYDVSNIVMRHRKGESYPEETYVTDSTFDVCPTCWKKHIVPFMKSLGAKPRKDVHNW